MKIFSAVILAISFFSGVLVHAAPSGRLDTRAITAFKESPEVIGAIDTQKSYGFDVEENPTSMVMSGGCGVAGCETTYLVGAVLSTQGANTRTTSVNALVTVSTIPGSQAVVTLAEIK